MDGKKDLCSETDTAYLHFDVTKKKRRSEKGKQTTKSVTSSTDKGMAVDKNVYEMSFTGSSRAG